MTEVLKGQKIKVDNMTLTVKHLQQHKKGRDSVAAKKEAEEKLFWILKKYAGRKQDGV